MMHARQQVAKLFGDMVTSSLLLPALENHSGVPIFILYLF